MILWLCKIRLASSDTQGFWRVFSPVKKERFTGLKACKKTGHWYLTVLAGCGRIKPLFLFILVTGDATMKLSLFICFMSFIVFIQCSPPPAGKYRTAKDIAGEVKSDGRVSYICKGKQCCSEHKECARKCNQMFYKSGKKIRNTCRSLPQDVVNRLEELILALRSALIEDLERLELNQEFRLLLALDYHVWIDIIQNYTVDEARELLIWMAANDEPVSELLQLEEEVRYEILYEVLASAGDRTRPGPVEEGLAGKISFDRSFFQLLVYHSNYDLLQITHEMMRENLCSLNYGGENQIEICMLRVYCKEQPERDGQYLHSEDLRNEMARNIQDEEFFDYVEKHVLSAGLGVNFPDPILNNQVCFMVCNDSRRGCE